MLVAVGDEGQVAVDVPKGRFWQEPVAANGAEGPLDPRVAKSAAAPEPVDQLVVEPLGCVHLRAGQANFTSRRERGRMAGMDEDSNEPALVAVAGCLFEVSLPERDGASWALADPQPEDATLLGE